MNIPTGERETMITLAGKILDEHTEFNDIYVLANMVLKYTDKKGTMHE
jgi:hypothetical protein